MEKLGVMNFFFYTFLKTKVSVVLTGKNCETYNADVNIALHIVNTNTVIKHKLCTMSVPLRASF